MLLELRVGDLISGNGTKSRLSQRSEVHFRRQGLDACYGTDSKRATRLISQILISHSPSQ